ncbi:hypothetical protein [Streptococcus suis]|uniref:hypothetical protein n=1 Tax=Streptococcus suis TaxID=1307 RepID=UPI001478897F
MKIAERKRRLAGKEQVGFYKMKKYMKTPLVKSSATSSLITRVPEVKLFGLAQTKYLRFYTCEVV